MKKKLFKKIQVTILSLCMLSVSSSLTTYAEESSTVSVEHLEDIDAVHENAETTNITLNTYEEYLQMRDAFYLVPSYSKVDYPDAYVRFTTSNPSVATVSDIGLVKGQGRGSANIKAELLIGSDVIGSAICAVTSTDEFSRIDTYQYIDKTVRKGTVFSIDVEIKPTSSAKYNKVVSFSSADTNIVDVDESGLFLIAKNDGETRVTATTFSGLTASYQVTVDTPDIFPSAITFNKPSIATKSGNIYTITATMLGNDINKSKITWKSSNKKVAVLDAGSEKKFNNGNGITDNINVKVIGVGKATITATTENGLKATCTITSSIGKTWGVKASSSKSTNITLNWSRQDGITGYELYRSLENSNKFKKIATVQSSTAIGSYKDNDVKAGVTYKYKIRSYKKSDSKTTYGEYTPILVASTATQKPSVTLSAKSKAVKVAWKKVNGAMGYDIYFSTADKGKYTLTQTITNIGTTSYTINKLKSNKSYYIKVRAYRTINGSKIYSEYSTIKSIKTKK